jgi:hypothetical protein
MDRLQISVSLLGLAAAFAGALLKLIHAILGLTLLWLSEAHISDDHLRRRLNAGREPFGTGNLVVQSRI